MKTTIVERLGEDAVLLLPDLLAAGLAANDRAKLRLTLLQAAARHAQEPGAAAPDLAAERRAAGLSDPAFDATVSGAQDMGEGRLRAPGAEALVAGLAADLQAMLAPVRAAQPAAAEALAARLSALTGRRTAAGDVIALADVAAMTSARVGEEGRDSEHQLVMDLHRAINSIAAETAAETIDGARAHGLTDPDRQRLRAFMRGLNRTRALAFGHPGLGTTASRAGERLIIQNDIGETDAHVLVVHVEALDVRITYTDVHRARARFFMALFEGAGAVWTPLAEDAARGLSEEFYLTTGRFTATDPGALEAFLERLGSRIVFLIDWNKARKALQGLAGKPTAIALLAQAAEQDVGHRAFLELGGVDLVLDAWRRLAGGPGAGERLDGVLEPGELHDFLGAVLRLCSLGLAAGRSARLIRDEIQADLARRLQGAEAVFLSIVLRHLGLSRMLAGEIRDQVGAGAADGAGRRALTERAVRLERKGDRLTLSARELALRLPEAGPRLRPVIDEMEHALDALDEAAWLLNLLPDGVSAEASQALQALADVAVESAAQAVRACEAAACAADGRRSDATDALQAVDAVMTAERAADAAERRLIGALFATPVPDARVPLVGLELARALEKATDHFGHGALALRDRLLEELSL